jgi:hypothetical protein
VKVNHCLAFLGREKFSNVITHGERFVKDRTRFRSANCWAAMYFAPNIPSYPDSKALPLSSVRVRLPGAFWTIRSNILLESSPGRPDRRPAKADNGPAYQSNGKLKQLGAQLKGHKDALLFCTPAMTSDKSDRIH